MEQQGSRQQEIDFLRDKAARLRIHSIRATTAAGSGHPTSCASAADLAAALFFSVMRLGSGPADDTFILSKGHAAPLLYAALAEAGVIPLEELTDLRKFYSRLEGHPTPHVPFVPVATGSLGQGLSAGAGMALSAKYLRSSRRRVYVLLGDGECMEGSVWEAASTAAHYRLSNLCAVVDVNGLGQSEPTILNHAMDEHRRRWEGFGWHALVVDGHDMDAVLTAFEKARKTDTKPTVLLAGTIKGKGIPGIEGKEGFHGKALGKEEALAAIAHLGKGLNAAVDPRTGASGQRVAANMTSITPPAPIHLNPPYRPGGAEMATRQGFGEALAAVGQAEPRVVTLDGDVKNSTGTQEFEKALPDRFFQMYIAEQNMVGAAMGLAADGWIPFASTFACFLTRAADFVRMAAISGSNIKLAGSHAGISIGEDGPSQMGLEDLAMFRAEPDFTVLYPSDATSAWRATELAAMHAGPVYIRTSRPKTPVIYDASEEFAIGRCKVVRQGSQDQVTVIAAGVTLFEALQAHASLQAEGLGITVVDVFSVQPLDSGSIAWCAHRTDGRVITVEDHYYAGGIGDAVSRALAPHGIVVHRMAVDRIAHSGEPRELMDHYGISARHIIETVKRICGKQQIHGGLDPVEEASIESFPASDAPAWT